MHLLSRMNVMLDFIWTPLPVKLRGTRNKWTLQKILSTLGLEPSTRHGLQIISRLKCMHQPTNCMHLFMLFIDHILVDIHINTYGFNSFTRKVGVAEWWRRSTCNLEAMPCGDSNPTVDKIICNVHLFRVPLSWTGSVQMKSSIKFIQGNRCIEKDIFKMAAK